MQRITADTAAQLFGTAASRRIEQFATAGLPPHTLMQRAGLAVARLAMAVAPDTRTIWIACGPGNNGGDGFEAATQLQRRGFVPLVTRIGDDAGLPPDAQASLHRARDAGVQFADAPPAHADLSIDALLGLGAGRAPQGQMADWLRRMHEGPAPVISIDLPSGLDADTGVLSFDFLPPAFARARDPRRLCLSLLTLKPGLFTAQGRDAAGELWFDDLGAASHTEPPTARLAAAPAAGARRHATHKGSYGDVAVIGGAPGMTGAALLAAAAALHAGAGRVYVMALDPALVASSPSQPELMFRHPDSLDLSAVTVVCGCGGGEAVRGPLPHVLEASRALVLDADALNAVAADVDLQRLLAARAGRPTVLTPHPLEAGRLLGIGAAKVQDDRLRAANELAQRFAATVVLKGSGTVIAAPNQTPVINPTGNARLATAGTGDVLAGMIGAGLAAGLLPFDASSEATWRHGSIADRWPSGTPFTAGALARG
ncbi:bifunctional ADP-dependent NAD(P)H-hydrate dehydratase/NAD(P)H-hydrate epimerase [Variovorax sp. KK3]|uniref:bifunctional ADP-dependent NAD(P)H-hydrate dehydratase/NAD(P)H-hydrate epimerase n=1 Tax=Variovorax sp. KK3 TaxID=1855728 RepID=UPI00097C3821|nr:bifunctional ADP-dependent NAD(P)H-hydrate dehydratase/NAD(P)H-hydrate epimerase [Variovorax sp. KK3]